MNSNEPCEGECVLWFRNRSGAGYFGTYLFDADDGNEIIAVAAAEIWHCLQTYGVPCLPPQTVLHVQQYGRAIRPTQSRRDSAVEVVTNTFVGMAGSYAITYVTFRLCQNIELASAITVAACTVWSLVRGYWIRRKFAAKVTL